MQSSLSRGHAALRGLVATGLGIYLAVSGFMLLLAAALTPRGTAVVA